MFKFGAAKKDITPLSTMCIPGYYEKRFVAGVTTRLYAKAMVFENEGQVAVAIVCDTINLNRDDVLRIRLGVAEACGIPEGVISASASHTHTGGPSWDWNDAAVRDPLYMNMLVEGAIAAATEAYGKLQPAKIGFVKTELPGYTFIRRFEMKDGTFQTNANPANILRPLGTPDESLLLGKVTDAEGKPLAFISNYGVHLDTVGGSNTNADYPGFLADLVAEKYGADVESIFFTGPCGNTNHINRIDYKFNNRVEEEYPTDPTYKKTGRAIFNALCELEGQIAISDAVIPQVSRDFFGAALRRPTKEYVETADRFLHGEDVKFMGYGMEGLGIKGRRHIALATMAAYNNPVHAIDVEVMTLVLGDTAIVTWPAEVFVEFGKAVREKFPDKNILIAELSNGSFGCYLPIPEAVEQGGYEPTITGAFTPDPKIGWTIVDSTIAMLEKTL